MGNVLIIDDDDAICHSLSRVIQRAGHEVTCVATLAEGLEQARSGEFEVVFLDVRLPDGNGLTILPQIQAIPDAPEVIISTGFGDPDGAELAIKSGAWDYIEKSASIKAIGLSLARALQYREEKKTVGGTGDVIALRREAIVGNSPRMKAALDLVAQAASSDVNVLITGDTGTGKELFAQAIHQNSRRVKENFVIVDCAALPETLVESLLFGHRKGAFTGADQDRDGLVRQADKGTLFLDEVGELPMALQKAFLRVLQEHRFRPLGSKQVITSDFRLVAATNRDINQMVQGGGFRSDLLFRISAFTIDLPSLKQHPEDIKELAKYHIHRLCDRYGIAAKGVSADFFDVLEAYHWPGNIRELVNTLERAITAGRYEPTLFPKHLPPQIRIQVTRETLTHEDRVEFPTYSTTLRGPKELPSLHDFRETIYTQAERQYLQDLITFTGHNIQKACRISGLSQSRIYALLKKHKIGNPE